MSNIKELLRHKNYLVLSYLGGGENVGQKPGIVVIFEGGWRQGGSYGIKKNLDIAVFPFTKFRVTRTIF